MKRFYWRILIKTLLICTWRRLFCCRRTSSRRRELNNWSRTVVIIWLSYPFLLYYLLFWWKWLIAWQKLLAPSILTNLWYRSFLTWNLSLPNCKRTQFYCETFLKHHFLYFSCVHKLLPSQLACVFVRKLVYKFIRKLVWEPLVHEGDQFTSSLTNIYIY